MGFGAWPQVHIFIKQALFELSHLPRPLFCFIMESDFPLNISDNSSIVFSSVWSDQLYDYSLADIRVQMINHTLGILKICIFMYFSRSGHWILLHSLMFNLDGGEISHIVFRSCIYRDHPQTMMKKGVFFSEKSLPSQIKEEQSQTWKIFSSSNSSLTCSQMCTSICQILWFPKLQLTLYN